ncbi:MAG: hypothetical protein MJ223_03875 [Mycoplasmoidaceae bacterium]|nr:hypothetical protein [Mycoplasmoidaceae bacterium]
MPINNIFYLEELNKANDRTFENILSDEKVIMNNAFCSEIWQKQEGIDYSNQ